MERFKPGVEEIEVGGRKVKRLVFEEKVEARGFVFPEIPIVEYEDNNGNCRKGAFSFEWTVFEKGVDFGYADFRKALEKTTINDIIPLSYFLSFQNSNFKGEANFEKAIFTVARFMGAQFNHAIFEVVEFGYADFTWSVFNIADFNWAIFKGDAVFEDSKFKIARFMGTKFDKGLFTRAQFEKAYFTDESLVYSGYLETIYDEWTEFKKADFSGAKFGELYLENVRVVEKLNFNGTIITERAALITKPPYDMSSLLDENCMDRQCWKIIDIANSFKVCEKRFCHPQPLAEMAKVQRSIYERLGDRENADRMFVLEMRAKRKLRMLQAKENLTNAKDFKNKLKAIMRYIGTWIDVQAEKVLADWITNYGTNWRRILKSSGFVILGTGFLYWVLSRFQTARDLVLGIPIGTIYTDGASKGIAGFLNALYYSLVTFTTLGYGDMHPTGWLKALSALEALTGAVFMALIVAVIARKWMR